MTAYRFYIWKNGCIISDCQRRSTVLNWLLKICRRSNPNDDVIYVQDTETDEIIDASEFVPSFVTNNE